jgi:dynein heavy chain 2
MDAQQEVELVVRGVCATQLPTLTFEDNVRFRALLGDVFPGVEVMDAVNLELEAAATAAAGEMGLELLPQQVGCTFVVL